MNDPALFLCNAVVWATPPRSQRALDYLISAFLFTILLFGLIANLHRRLARQLAHGRPARVQNRRHDRRDDDALDGLQVDLVQVQQVFQLHAVLIGRFEQVRLQAGL